MGWYYVLNGTSHGPVAEANLRRLREDHTIGLDTQVWTEGMSGWVSFQSSPLSIAGEAPVATQPCTECRKLFPEGEMLQYENVWVCAACKPVFFQRLKEGVKPMGTLAFASVGQRVMALLVDSIAILFGIVLCLMPFFIFGSWVVGPGDQVLGDKPWFVIPVVIIVYGFAPAYEIFFVGRFGATLGKMLMKIKVVTSEGGRVSYARSTGRYFAKILSGMTIYIGFLMAFWDDQKRTLHDRICTTLVITR